MPMFAGKEAFETLGLEPVPKSIGHVYQNCAICTSPLDIHPDSPGKITQPGLHAAVRIIDCGHIVGKECLSAWLDTGHTCPTCNRMLFETRGRAMTKRDVDRVLLALGPVLGKERIQLSIRRVLHRQNDEFARQRREYEAQVEESQAEKNRRAHSEDDAWASDEEMELDWDEEDEEMEEEESEDGEEDESSGDDEGREEEKEKKDVSGSAE